MPLHDIAPRNPVVPAHWLVVVAIAAFYAMAAGSTAAAQASSPIGIGSVKEHARSSVLGRVIDLAIAPSGDLWVADLSLNEIIHFDTAGTEIGRIGRNGEGPGEFRMLYRLAVDPSGNLYAFDFASSDVSVFDAAGEYLDRWRLPVFFAQVDRFVVVPDGRVVVAGIAANDSAASGSSLHVFSAAGEHVTSFGPLPRASNRALLRFWGAGNLSLSSHGDLLLSLRLPYEIFSYSPDGRLRARIVAPTLMAGSADDAFTSRGDANSGSIADSETYVPRPLFAYDIGDGLVLAGRSAGRDEPAVWDVFDADGQLIQSIRAPEPVRGVLGLDRERARLWGVGTTNDEPVLFSINLIIRR